MKAVQATKILTEDSSFQLVRTNPRLTGNVKLVVDEAGELWLESIKVNQELSKDIYSKVAVDSLQSHPANIFRFFNGGQTPNEIIFDISEQVDSTKTSSDYKDQYDFSHYFSGAKYLASKKYSERISYFAPIYLKKDIPSYFIIVKIKDPANLPLDQIKNLYESGQTKSEYLIDLFKRGSIVKTFDLRPETKIGKYIRDYVNNPNFPKSPLTVGFGEDEYTNWNGILINEGSFGYRGELLNSLYINSQPLKSFEENITNGYSRNGIIFPEILNLEFVFNDSTTKKYDFDRYIGFYVNAIELTKLDIDLDRAYQKRTVWENVPPFKKKYLETDDVTLLQSNPDGVLIPYKNATVNLSEFNDSFKDASSLYATYISDKDGNLYMPSVKNPLVNKPFVVDYSDQILLSISTNGTTTVTATSSIVHNYITDDLITISCSNASISGEVFITKIDDFTFSYEVSSVIPAAIIQGTSIKELGSGQIRFANDKIDLGLFFGQSRPTFLQDKGFSSSLPGHSHSVIKINKNPNNYDEIKIYHPNGTRPPDSIGKYDLIQMTQGYSLIPNPGDYYVYNDYDNVLGYDEFYVNSQGYLYEVAQAIAECINGIRNRAFTAYPFNEYVFIKLNIPGNLDVYHKTSFVSPTSDYSVFSIDGISGSNLIGQAFDFKGGSKEKNNRLIIDSGHLTKLNNNLDSILIKSSDSYSKISKISQYIDEINESNTIDADTRSKAIASYLEKIAIVLAEPEEPTVTNAEFLMKSKFRPAVGLLSFFLIKDLDFDFYSSTYTNFPEIDLYKNYFVPAETSILQPGKKYRVWDGTILIEGQEKLDGDPFQVTQANSKYSIVSGAPIVTFDDDYLDPILDINNEIGEFAGFSLLKDPSKIEAPNPSKNYMLKTKYLNGLTKTEYDFYKENESSDFALRSKMIPYITKWGIKNGTDSRSNPYRLNSEIVFGRNNFSPDHIDTSQNPINFTHEWFYIESKFDYVNDNALLAKNYYYFEEKLDEDRLLNEADYFINYFTYTPTNSQGEEIGETQFRYSNLIQNSAGQYEAFFKGFKVTFKDVVDPNVFGPDDKPKVRPSSTEFDGYKFSCMLRPVEEEINSETQQPITYRVIKHADFKFVLILIDVVVGQLSEIDPYWLSGNPVDLTTFNFNDTTLFTPIDVNKIYPFDTINGDYRITFDGVNGVSDLTHTFLYSLKHKKYNAKENKFSNVRLASRINISTLGVNSINQTIKRINNYWTPNYPSTLSEGITKLNKESIIYFRDLGSDKDLFISSKVGPLLSGPGWPTPNLENLFDIVSEQFIHYDLSGGKTFALIDPIYPTVSQAGSIPLGSSSTASARSYVFKVFQGGEKYFERLFEKLSFAKFKKYVNEQNQKSIYKPIEYYTYSLNSLGQATLQTTPAGANDPRFYLQINDQSQIEKKNQIIANTTQSIPVQFSGLEDIGSEYEVADLPVKYEINRYNGGYEPLTVNYSIFESGFKFNKNKIEDISLANIKINPNLESMFTISNFNHIKVADTQILELESDDSYFPLYPKLNEIAIDQAEYFLLRGNWDWGFHIKYLNKSESLPVSGALRVEEDESFVSKLITLPEYIELETFDKTDATQYLSIGSDQDLDKIDLSNREIVIKETPNTVEGVFNLNNTITRFLLTDGISAKFNEYLINSNEFIGNFNKIEEYIKQYIKLNILKLYDVDINEFYSKSLASVDGTSNQAGSNPNGISFEFMSDKQRFTAGYTQLKSVKINKKDKLVIRFSLNKTPGTGLLISPKIKIKFI